MQITLNGILMGICFSTLVPDSRHHSYNGLLWSRLCCPIHCPVYGFGSAGGIGCGSGLSYRGLGFGYGLGGGLDYGYGSGALVGGSTNATVLGSLSGVIPQPINQIPPAEIMIQPPSSIVTISGPILPASCEPVAVGGTTPCAVVVLGW